MANHSAGVLGKYDMDLEIKHTSSKYIFFPFPLLINQSRSSRTRGQALSPVSG
jgi:hypothetical protein